MLVAAAAIAAGIFLWPRPASPPPQTATAQVNFGGPFTLVAAPGQPFASNKLAGRPYAIFFGFTHCPDVCPTTLARLVKLRRLLGSDDAFQIVFVTVDPERDGPREVGSYTQLFGSKIIGLTGSTAQIAKVKKDYGIFSEKVGTGDAYTVDHTATVLLFDKDQKFQSTISPEESDDTALAKLKRLAGQS
jgi:protein SCO1/2